MPNHLNPPGEGAQHHENEQEADDAAKKGGKSCHTDTLTHRGLIFNVYGRGDEGRRLAFQRTISATAPTIRWAPQIKNAT